MTKVKLPQLPSFSNLGSLKELRLADLDLFITAAHLKNLGQAAIFQHLSQSAASAAILRVEKAFGKPLCTHERRHFRLTQEGQRFLPRAETWMKALRDAVAIEEIPPIRVATTHAVARVCIPAVLPLDTVALHLMRPDHAYAAVLRDEADVALVLDNAPWDDLLSEEIGQGKFQLYCSAKKPPEQPVLLPEDQIEVISLQKHWEELYQKALPIKARLPSWSLIADICAKSKEVGLLPDFLARPSGLHPVSWQPPPSGYRILALYRNYSAPFKKRLEAIFKEWRNAFAK